MNTIRFIDVDEVPNMKVKFDGLIHDLYPKNSPRHILGHAPVERNLYGKYLGVQANQVLCRFALYDNPILNYGGKPVLTIGSFESVNDPDLMGDLVDFIKNVAKQLGKMYLIGPMEGSSWENYRFSLSNDNPPFFSEPYHHTYYNQLFEQAGFVSIARYISQLDKQMAIDEPAILKQEDRFIKMGARFRNLDQEDIEGDLKEIALFCNRAFKDNFLFTPIDPNYFAVKYAKLSQFMDPDLVWVVEDANGQIQAVSLCFPDWANTDVRGFVYKTMARDPNSNFKGIGRHLAGKSYQVAFRKGYKQAIHAFMIDKNASVSVSDQYSGSAYKTYQLYGQEV